MSTMSKMTSSTHQKPKPLTNFSIESLIGGSTSATHIHNQSPIITQPTPLQHAITKSPNQTLSKMGTPSDANPNPVAQQAQKKYRPKNFQCPACKMAFSNNGQLKNHVRIHTGERPFKCNHLDCDKTFTRNEELTRHKLIHTGVRPHSCTTCGKRFGRKDHLKKHVKTHERKRIRRKVFAPPTQVFSRDANPMFVPPIKPSKISSGPMQRLSCVEITSDLTKPSIINCLEMPLAKSINTRITSSIPTTFSALPQVLNTTTTIAPSPTVQQLASDYWNQWYNLIGFYQHCQPNSATDRLSDLFRKS